MMGETYPVEIQLADVLAFNERLLAISKAGVPVLLTGDPSDLPGVIERMNGRIALRVGRGGSMAEILTSEPELNAPYRQALTDWVVLGRSMVAAEPVVGVGRWRRLARDRFVSTFGGLWFLWVFASLGFVAMVANLTPKLRGFYDVAGLEPGAGFRVLEKVEANLLVIALMAIGISLISIFLWRWISAYSSLRWVPKSTSVATQACRAAAARDAFACLQNRNGITPDTFRWMQGQLLESGEDANRKETSLGEMMGWALRSSEDPKAIASSLLLVSDVQHSQLAWMEKRGIAWLPLLVYQLVGGFIVLASGLMLFWPLVELLTALCK